MILRTDEEVRLPLEDDDIISLSLDLPNTDDFLPSIAVYEPPEENQNISSPARKELANKADHSEVDALDDLI